MPATRQPTSWSAGSARGGLWRVGLWLLAGIGLFAARPSLALDYDRNDILTRSVGLGFAIAPIRTCTDCSAPMASFVQAAAGRQTRFLFVATEVQLGVVFNGHPWLSLGGITGFETADNAFVPLRAYGQLGVAFTYMSDVLADLLVFSAEAGMRYQVRSYSRPHAMLFMGVRALSNLGHTSGMVHGGLMWTFD